MNPDRRSAKPGQRAASAGRRPLRPVNGEGTNNVHPRPDPRAEPIPDGEHKYVPRSPYRTGNH